MIGNIFACKIVLVANHLYPGIIQKLFRLQKCLSSKTSKISKYSKTLSPAKLSQPQIIYILQNSKTFSPAKLSSPQIIDILEIFKDIFACKNFLAATHHYSERIQRIFACKIVLAANHRYPGNIQRLFRLQTCLKRKSSISLKYSKTFSAVKLSQPQTIYIPELFKDFFGCKIILVATHQNSENIEGLYRLQICLSRRSSISWKYSKTFSPANLSQPQIVDILEIFKDFFGCKFVSAANHLYPGNIQKLFACKVVLAANYRYPGNIQSLFRLQNCVSSNPSKI